MNFARLLAPPFPARHSLLPPYADTVTKQRRDRKAELSARWGQPIAGDGQLSGLAALERGIYRAVRRRSPRLV